MVHNQLVEVLRAGGLAHEKRYVNALYSGPPAKAEALASLVLACSDANATFGSNVLRSHCPRPRIPLRG